MTRGVIPKGIKSSLENNKFEKLWIRGVGQDGVVGGYTLLPHTTERRTTTNLKTKNNPNCQISKLHGNLTTKELKKHLSRLTGGAETESQSGEDAWQGSRPGWARWPLPHQDVPHSHVDKPGGTTG